MATSWVPRTEDLRGQLTQWATSIRDDDARTVAKRAAHEVVGKVGAFDPTAAINPRAKTQDRVTLGHLAHNVATLRACYLWMLGFAPEQIRGSGLADELKQAYAEALDELRTNVEMHGRIGHGEPITGSVRMTLPALRPGGFWG